MSSSRADERDPRLQKPYWWGTRRSTLRGGAQRKAVWVPWCADDQSEDSWWPWRGSWGWGEWGWILHSSAHTHFSIKSSPSHFLHLIFSPWSRSPTLSSSLPFASHSICPNQSNTCLFFSALYPPLHHTNFYLFQSTISPSKWFHLHLSKQSVMIKTQHFYHFQHFFNYF